MLAEHRITVLYEDGSIYTEISTCLNSNYYVMGFNTYNLHVYKNNVYVSDGENMYSPELITK